MFKKIAAWLHRHPKVKQTVVGAGSAAVAAAAAGEFGPKAQTYAAIVTAAVGMGALNIKRPADATLADKAGIALGDVVRFRDRGPEAGNQLMIVVELKEVEGAIQVALNWFEGSALKSGWAPLNNLEEV